LSRTDVKPDICQKIPLGGNSGQFRPQPDIRWDVGLTWLYHGLRLALACVFIYAGFMKLLGPKAFAHAIAQYDLVPEGLLPVVAIGLPALELLAGLGLIFEVRGSLTITVILLLMFLVVLGYAVWQNLDIDCGCFTAEDLEGQEGLKIAFRRDLIMLGAMLWLYWRRRSRSPQSLWIGKLKITLKGETPR
jgi:uncharacterized membrane protein YphA (DoxX/SURF4 family)